MKVLHLISGGDTGGAKTHILSLFHGLNKLIDAKIICFIEDSFYFEAKEAGIDIEVYQQKSRADMSVVTRLANEINDNNYDIIHCHGARANFVAMFLKLKVKKTFITTVHSDYRLDFKDNFYKQLIFAPLNALALRRIRYYIAVSDSFKEMLVERGFKEDRIFTVYNGINLQQNLNYDSREDYLKSLGIEDNNQKIVGIVARLDRVKDHETFLKAAKEVLKKQEDTIFLIAGDGSERERLEKLADEYRIKDRVYFLGHISEIYSFLNTIDINVLTSISESFPYSILEGALMKKTIISTRVGGLVNLIEDGENGYLTDVGDWKTIASRILELLEDKEKRIEMGNNLYKKVEECYSSEKMAEDHFKIYKKILREEGNSYDGEK